MPKAIMKHTEEKNPILKYVHLRLIVVTPNLKSPVSSDFLYSLWKERDTSKLIHVTGGLNFPLQRAAFCG